MNIKNIIKSIRAKREQAQRRELQLRAADNIYLTDRNGEVILSYRGVALYHVLDTKNETIISSPEYVSLDVAMRQLDRLRREYVNNHLYGTRS